jgi:hypothetical protein
MLRRRRFGERDWPLGKPIHVLVDDAKGESYMQDPEHRKEIDLRYRESVTLEQWRGCDTEMK